VTERLADVSARIAGIRQLGAVVNAMRGIAAARARQARSQVVAVDRYAATIAAAIGRALSLLPNRRPDPARTRGGLALVLFCAEQGFAGPFSERVLDAAGPDLGTAALFVAGTRGAVALAQRQIEPGWTGVLPSHSPGLPRLATAMATALYARLAAGDVHRLEVIFCQWDPGGDPGHGVRIVRQVLLPIDPASFPPPSDANVPLLNLPPAALLQDLAVDYLHAQLCHAALHGFAAENEARMEAMAAAHTQTNRKLLGLQATERRVRQEEITAEIIELAAGEAASRERSA
jgi:F-type H+-transporting ATPase subunit gamma